MAESNDVGLPASKLGTKEYWDTFYERDVKVYKETGDSGEIWFGEACEQAMIEWLEDNVPKDNKIIEIGSGNGHLLVELSNLQYKNLLGVDYSDHATALARKVAHDEDILSSELSFVTYDLFSKTPIPDTENQIFNTVLDKGTYDAISLLAKSQNDTAPVYKQYPRRIWELLESEGQLLLVSCNWTRDELIRDFVENGPGFEVDEEIDRPKFEFGGATGQTETMIVFKKKAN